MKCPKCGKVINPKATTCKHCKVRIVRKSDKMARKMTMNARIAMASGGLLVLIGIILAFNNVMMTGGLAFAIGAALIGIGKLMS